MAANSNLSLLSLDMPTLMSDFRTFMQSQDQFKDYNFEGSNISALIRLLSYNTFKNSFYTNMAFSEGFLDTSQTLPAILSRAKELNYLPRSTRSAKATISFSFNGTQPVYVLPKGTTFSAIVKNIGLNFSLNDSLLCTSTNGSFTVSTDIYEGIFQADSFVIDYSNANQRFILSNKNIDTSSLTVLVYQDNNPQGVLYSYTESLLDLTEVSKVYFLQATGEGDYEVIFGDGVSGYRPPNGSTAVFDYRVSSGDGGNGAEQFTLNNAIGQGISNVSQIFAASASSGGAAMESLDSIRFYAPRHFQTQERAVGNEDYITLLKIQFPEIHTASAIGGEDLDPPQYGKVFIAVDISDVDGLPDSKKQAYTNYIQTRCSLTTNPVFIEPKYTYIDVDTTVTYNLNQTTLTPNNISTMVLSQISTFANNNIDDFGTTLRYSRFVSNIDAAHPSIIGNETSISVYKKISPQAGSDNTLTLSFGMALASGTPVSNVFPTRDARCISSDTYISLSGIVYLTDDGNGRVWVASDQNASTRLITQVGTIDYTKGTIALSKWNVQNYTGDSLRVFATTTDKDIVAPNDTILSLDIGSVNIRIIEDRE